MFYVYILLSLKDQRFHVGSTKDLKRRFSEHQSGAVESTRHRRPLYLLGYEAYQRLDEAVVRERYLKSSDARKEFRVRFAKSLCEFNA
ncbi:MAG: GIY-YIG nuclease family protein [Patescibacteria group bacterium]|nr:GIY-YIG nuclease family protein [Patescibacteria group bacterium]